MLAVAPIDFPNDLEMRIYPHDRVTAWNCPAATHTASTGYGNACEATAPLEPQTCLSSHTFSLQSDGGPYILEVSPSCVCLTFVE
jgi:hypothetical protein